VSPYSAARDGSHTLTLSYLVPSNQTTAYTASYTTFGNPLAQSISGGTDYTVFATGTIANPQLVVTSGTKQRDPVGDNHLFFQVANAAPDAGPLAVTVTFPEAGITSPQDLGSLAFGQATDPSDVTLTSGNSSSTGALLAGTISLQFRDSAGTLVLDSGPISVTEQARLLFVAMDRLGPGAAPVQMLIVGGTGGGAGTVVSASSDAAEFNFANISPDAGPLDLIASSPPSQEYATNIALGQQSPFNVIPNQSTGTIATPHGNHGSFLFVQQVTPVANASYTLYAQGPLASISGVLVPDDRRSVPTEARLRFFVGASSRSHSPPTDIYVTPAGGGLDLAGTHVAASVASLGYLSPSSYVPVAAGSYDVYMTVAGSATTIIGPVNFSAPAGSVQTLVLTDQADGSLALLPFDDARH
jgi:hypothetical protein